MSARKKSFQISKYCFLIGRFSNFDMTRREAFEKGTSVIIKLSKLHSVSTNHIKLLNQSTFDLVVLSFSQSETL